MVWFLGTDFLKRQKFKNYPRLKGGKKIYIYIYTHTHRLNIYIFGGMLTSVQKQLGHICNSYINNKTVTECYLIHSPVFSWFLICLSKALGKTLETISPGKLTETWNNTAAQCRWAAVMGVPMHGWYKCDWHGFAWHLFGYTHGELSKCSRLLWHAFYFIEPVLRND